MEKLESMTFGPWEPDDHTSLHAWKRIQSAADLNKKRIVSVDKDSESGIFTGSSGETYRTNLYECSCVDFARNDAPCKHMYRLAQELGYPVLELVPQFDPYKAWDYKVDDDIACFREKCKAGVITIDAYAKIADALQKSASKAKRRPADK